MSDDPEAMARKLGVEMVVSRGRRLAIPTNMPALIQDLVAHAEVWWCTTWRARANLEIADHLGVGALPVIDDGTDAVGLAWKIESAQTLIDSALASGRTVYWIEDFGGTYPDLPEVQYIDTDETGYLVPGDIPKELTSDALD